MSDQPPADIGPDNWITEGRKKVSKMAQNDKEYAEKLKEENPEMYYSFDWTPEPPNRLF